MRTFAVAAVAVVLLLAGPGRAQDDKVFTKLTLEESEAILKKLNLEFKKTEGKLAGTAFYDFKLKNFNVRYYHYEGKDLMLDAVFPRLPLERVNEWNVRAKFTRACLQRNPKGDFITLESNLDLIGGVTEGTIKQFFRTFEEELKGFAKFSGDTSNEDQIFSPVTDEKIESILRSLGIAAEKKQLKQNAGHYYDFEFAGHRLRLVNFGGKDLMIDAHFKKIPLEDINRYNLEKKFVRVVGYNLGGQEYTSLESNLDCEIGTTDGILRNFLLGFQDDVKNFAKYVQSR